MTYLQENSDLLVGLFAHIYIFCIRQIGEIIHLLSVQYIALTKSFIYRCININHTSGKLDGYWDSLGYTNGGCWMCWCNWVINIKSGVFSVCKTKTVWSNFMCTVRKSSESIIIKHMWLVDCCNCEYINIFIQLTNKSLNKIV